MKPSLTAASLFSSGGIGDLAVRESGFDILLSNELLHDRHQLYRHNFPTTRCISGDIRTEKEKFVTDARSLLDGRDLDLLFATPPCQGMSKNGRGKLLNAIRAGRKPPIDERNLLIIPTIWIAKELRPRIVVLENVPEMKDAVIPDGRGGLTEIVKYVASELDEYRCESMVVEFADYGVPQCRQRLITILTRDPRLADRLDRHGTLFPPRTHSERGVGGTERWVTVRDAIAELPPLDAASRENARSTIPHHRVPLLDPLKYWWVSNTPPERSAFDNQCGSCGFEGNPVHVARRDDDGINRPKTDTPLYCVRCGELLPRPSVGDGERRRIMRGFTSAYKRMSYDRPASALTRNLSYACSDNKLHPEQNRVLSLHEAFVLHTLDRFDYSWKRADGKRVADKLVRDIIGESIPPAGLQVLVSHVAAIYQGRTVAAPKSRHRLLFPV